MKTHINSLFVLIALTSLTFSTSCNKSDNHSWEGTVLEYGSNKPVANAQCIWLRKAVVESSGL